MVFGVRCSVFGVRCSVFGVRIVASLLDIVNVPFTYFFVNYSIKISPPIF